MTPEKAEWMRRWTATTRAKVAHRKRGSVIVPATSKLTALMNAAEYWRTDWMKIKDAEVLAVEPNEGPTVRPKMLCKKP